MTAYSNGIIQNAFYKRNHYGDTKETFWGRSQGSNTEVFCYGENEEGKITITEKQQ